MIIIPKTAGFACTLSLGNKPLHNLILNKYKKYKILYERDQQTNKSFDNLYRNSFQDNIVDKNEHGSLSNIFTKNFDEFKNEPLYKHENKNKINLS